LIKNFLIHASQNGGPAKKGWINVPGLEKVHSEGSEVVSPLSLMTKVADARIKAAETTLGSIALKPKDYFYQLEIDI